MDVVEFSLRHINIEGWDEEEPAIIIMRDDLQKASLKQIYYTLAITPLLNDANVPLSYLKKISIILKVWLQDSDLKYIAIGARQNNCGNTMEILKIGEQSTVKIMRSKEIKDGIQWGLLPFIHEID